MLNRALKRQRGWTRALLVGLLSWGMMCSWVLWAQREASGAEFAPAPVAARDVVLLRALPAWVKLAPIDTERLYDESEAEQGVAALLDVERLRFSEAGTERFVRQVHQIVTSVGVEF